MGAEWDRDLPSQRIFDECLRVLKPGGHIFVMSSERLDCIAGFYHLLANAGFEVDNHQLIGWLTLSGMPKSSDVAKTADKEAFRAWLAMHRETVTCPDHKEPIDPVTKERQRCAECERIFLAGKLTHHDKRKAESAAVNGECPPQRSYGSSEVFDAIENPARGGMANPEYAAQRHRDGAGILSRLLASHWPASPAEQRAHWEACIAEVPEEWDCSRPPGVRVKTGRNERTCIGPSQAPSGDTFGSFLNRNDWENSNVITAPSTPDAVALDGWRGSVAPFKPMLAPILHAVKPWRGSYLDCARESGGGVLNVEAGRIPFGAGQHPRELYGESYMRSGHGQAHNELQAISGSKRDGVYVNDAGRVPGNLLSYGDLLADLQRYADLSAWCEKLGLPASAAELLEAGLVYSPKPSRAEKEAGLEGFAEVVSGMSNGAKIHGEGYDKGQDCGLNRVIPRRNNHPTAKPVSLCAYLVTLATAPGQTVLDPFCGSGSTGVAAALLGRRFVGVELSEEFAAIARARIAHAASAAADTPAEVSPQPALMEVLA